ncbi:MAG TPA: hypothetical protein VFE12_21675 [Acetobacteraceae bacterium]|nr:hypothetical protein [Acetobacteraceae bacterium]
MLPAGTGARGGDVAVRADADRRVARAERDRLRRAGGQQVGRMMTGRGEVQHTFGDVIDPVPHGEEQVVVPLHREHAVEAADDSARFAEIHLRQHPLAQHVGHGDREQRSPRAMTRDVQHVGGETAAIEHLISERVAAETRARLVVPFRLHRSRGDRRRQHRQHVVAGLGEFALQRIPAIQFLLAAAVIGQRMRTDGDARAVLEHQRRGDALTVDEGAVGGLEILQYDVVALAFEPAVATRDSTSRQHHLGRRAATHRQWQQMQRHVARRRILRVHQQQMCRRLGVRPRRQRRRAKRQRPLGEVFLVRSGHRNPAQPNTSVLLWTAAVVQASTGAIAPMRLPREWQTG